MHTAYNTNNADYKIVLVFSAIAYLEKWFDFTEDSYSYKATHLALIEGIPSYQHMLDLKNDLNLSHVDEDVLYEEHSGIRRIPWDNIKSLSSPAEKWSYILNRTPLFPETTKLVSYILSIPTSNAGPERVFSLMTAKWTKERNRASTVLIKSELQVACNMKIDCKAFYAAVLKDDALLKKCRQSTKYCE